jgi:hypothetical protein
LAWTIVHTPIAPEMEQGEATSLRIRLPYRDVCKFQHDGSNADKIPKMLWKMLQELGYEKQPKYYGTQLTYEGSEPCGMFKSTSLPPSPSEEFLNSRRSMPPSLQDVPSMLELVMLPTKLTWSLVHAIAKFWMERSMLISP